MDPPTDAVAATLIFADMKAAKVPLSESIYTAMIRCYSMNNRQEEALHLYEEIKQISVEILRNRALMDAAKQDVPSNEENNTENNNNDNSNNTNTNTNTNNMILKLRTFSSLLHVYSTIGDCETCMSLYHDMTYIYGIFPLEREYVYLLNVCAHAKEELYFYHILHQMKEDILIPSSELTWPILQTWFTHFGYDIHTSSVDFEGNVLEVANAKLQSIELDKQTKEDFLYQIECYALNRAYMKKGSHSTVNTETNADTNNNTPVKRSNNYESKWIAFKDWINALPQTNYSVSREEKLNAIARFNSMIDDSNNNKNTNNNNDVDKNTHTNNKSAKLTSHNGTLFPVLTASTHFDVIVDGANVGYFQQNFPGAPEHIDYMQLHSLISQLIFHNYSPLLILHNRHTQPHMCREFAHIVNLWKEWNILFVTPSGWNDDWFWLYSAVRLGVHVITNDEMRDHHFQMLSARFVMACLFIQRICMYLLIFYDIFYVSV